jgi:hypothetical protein
MGEVARERRLRALGIEPLRLRRRVETAAGTPESMAAPARSPAAGAAPAAPPSKAAIRRLALQPDPVELRDPAINMMYQALTAAVPKAGLQSVRPCDVAEDPGAAVMVFGDAPPPEGVPMSRVLRVDPLTVLHADRERKRVLWERMLLLGRGSG